MSGFSDVWLNARAAWDSPARNRSVEDALIGWISKKTSDGGRLRVVDLGSGNGNNQRHLAPLLSQPVDWILVDSDQALLATAKRTAVLKPDDSLDTRITDLAHADLARLLAGADLVTASALFDLVSQSWLDDLLHALAAEKAALLAVLTYDGRIETDTGQEAVADLRRFVNLHQQTDKGFGPALGPDASALLSAGLSARAYDVREGQSDWVVLPGDSGMPELVDGWIEAASEMAPQRRHDFESWAERLHARPQATIRVGHRDHFATPGLR